jgi:hypothetical protein
MVARAEAERMAQALEDVARSMDGASIGQHPVSGHANIARRLASDLRAQVALGWVPFSFSDSGMYASAATSTLPAPVLADLRASGLEVLAGDGETISITDLDASFAETGVDPSARFRIKSALASAGKLTT